MASQIFVDDVTVDETASFVDVTVRLDVASNEPVSVRYSMANDTAQHTRDYTATSGTLNFAAGETVKTVRVTLLPDTSAEPTENFYFTLNSPANATLGDAVGRVTIIDNDAPSGTPRLAIGDLVIDEAAREARFVITLDRPSTSTVSFNYATQNGTAVAGEDYTATAGSFSLAPGETARTVVVPLTDDTIPELNESFSLVLSNLVNATSLDPVGTATVWENDTAPVSQPALFVDDVTVDESAAYVDVVVRLSAPSPNPVSVRYSMANDTAQHTRDYYAEANTLNFAPGETAKTVRVTLLPDVDAEATENFYVVLSSPTNATLGDSTGRVTLIDNDALSGTPRLAIGDLVIDEAAREARFVITLDRPSTSTVSFNYATQNGTAVAGEDYTATAGSFSLAPGETARTVVVPLTDDTIPELNESFSLVLSNLVNATSLDPVGTATVWENDTAPVSQPALFVDDVTVDESAAYVDVVVRLSAPSPNPVSVRYSMANDTAQHTRDYYAEANTLNFAPGETAKTVRVTLLPDVDAEATENFYVVLSSPTNATLGDSTGRVTLIDNDALSGTPRLAIGDLVIDEAAREARFVITLDRPSTSTVSFNYATQNGTAVAGSDFVATAGAFSLAPGETARTVVVPLIDDTAAESNESFSLVLTHLANATAPDPVGTATLWENDTPSVSQPALSIDNVAVNESQTHADVVVRLSAPSPNPVSVRYSMANDTAQHTRDYYAEASTLNFAPGETVKTVRVTLLPDVSPELAETFYVTLNSPTNATLANNRGTVTIHDDDSSPAAAGPAGDNVYDITDPTTRITEPAGSGTDLVRAPFTYTLGDNVENLTLLGDGPFNAYGNTLNNVLTGNAGNNTLVGGAGNDALDGGAGLDAAVFSGNRASYRIEKDGLQWVVTALNGNDGLDRLSNIETLVFADTSLTLIPPPRTGAPVYGQNNSFLFDPVYYLLNNPELIPSVGLAEAVTHYLTTGANQGERPNSWFDAAYYANRWDDLRPLNLDATTLFQHYNLFGVWEGRSAGPVFDTFNGNRYLADNPDVAAYVDAFIGDFLGSRTNGAIAHYIIYGANEGRLAYDATGTMIELGYIV